MIDRATSDLRLSDLRLVEWDLVQWDIEADSARGPKPTIRSTTRELVPADEVPLLVEGLRRLHHEPGVNPHSGRPTARLERVRVGTATLNDGYWWTGPTLQDEGPKARLVGWHFEVVWEQGGVDDEPLDPA